MTRRGALSTDVEILLHLYDEKTAEAFDEHDDSLELLERLRELQREFAEYIVAAIDERTRAFELCPAPVDTGWAEVRSIRTDGRGGGVRRWVKAVVLVAAGAATTFALTFALGGSSSAGEPAVCGEAVRAADTVAAAIDEQHATASAAVDAAQRALDESGYREHAEACRAAIAD